MTLGNDDADELANALTPAAVDAVERDGYRAEWTDDATAVRVRNVQ